MSSSHSSAFQDESLLFYFDEISKTPLLSFEEELELSRKIEKGDAKAKAVLVRSNLRLVVKIAKVYMKCGIGFQDLIQEGNMGLMTAAEKYDYRKNVRFSTYASWWIRQSIVRAITNKKRLIRLPHRKEEILRRINKYLTECISAGINPTSQSIAEYLRIDQEDVVMLLDLINPVTSLDKEINDDNSTVKDVVEDNSFQPDVELLDECVRQDTRALLDQLLEKERTIIMSRFAFEGGKRATLKTLGKQLGLSAETVRQIEMKALDKLQQNAESMKDYVYN